MSMSIKELTIILMPILILILAATFFYIGVTFTAIHFINLFAIVLGFILFAGILFQTLLERI